MCIFCKIVKGEIPNQTILEDENFLAFNDINPTRKIHVLIIPKKHYESFDVTPPEVMAGMTEFIQKVALKLDVKESGYKYARISLEHIFYRCIIISSYKEAGRDRNGEHEHQNDAEYIFQPSLCYAADFLHFACPLSCFFN